MSRSIPTITTSNPSKRWFEWDGANGSIRYYDKTKKENIDVGDQFSFLLLDELAVIKGWHDPSQSGITSNEIHNVRTEKLFVKSFDGGPIAEGYYADIKEKLHTAGGRYCANLYIAFKESDGMLILGSLKFKGGGLGAWVEFAKKNKSSLYSKSISINGATEGKKGRVVFKMPVFSLKDISEETNKEAEKLDAELQKYLAIYFANPHEENTVNEAKPQNKTNLELEEDEIPF